VPGMNLFDMFDSPYPETSPIATGISDLDEHNGGLLPGTVTGIGGSDGDRKAEIAREIAVGAISRGSSVLHIPVFTTARNEAYAYRALLARTPPPPEILEEVWEQRHTGLISDADFLHRLDEALSYERLIGKLLTVYNDPLPPLTWLEIKDIIEHQLRTSPTPPQVVVINYLTFASPHGLDLFAEAQRLAHETRVAIVTPVHLPINDEINARYDGRPPVSFIHPSVVSPFLDRCIYVASANNDHDY
jgi:hypothetical protein